MQNGSHVADDRQALESRLNTLYALLRQLEELNEQRDAVYARYRHLYRPLAEPWGKGMWWLWFFLLGTGTFVVLSMSLRVLPELESTSALVTFTVTAMLLPPVVAIVGATIVKRHYNTRRLPVKNDEITRENRATRERIEEMAAPDVTAIDRKIGEVSDAYNTFGYVGFFPERYLNSADVGRCWNFVRDHRAFSVQQAIDLLEEELHRARMENFQAAQLAENERTRRMVQVGNLINAIGHFQTHQDLRDIHDRM